jgi:hypothetical protein
MTKRAKTHIYSLDMKLCATVYVRAASKDEALTRAKAFASDTFEFNGETVSGRQFNDPKLPDVSLSPAMTGHGLWDAEPVPELAE